MKHLITGNHDGPHPMHSQAHRRQGAFLRAFVSVQQSGTRRIAGRRVLMSHFPYGDRPDSDHTLEPRYGQWRLPNEGMWLLHGHTHNAAQRVHGRQIHIGLDAHNLTPVSEKWVQEQIEATSTNEEIKD